MEDINKLVIIGRLTADAELAYTNSGSPVIKGSVAVNRSKKEGDQWVDKANFFSFELWGKRGESLAQYLVKGTRIALDGSLEQDRWEKDGQKHSKVYIHCDNIQLLGSPQNAGQGNSNNNGGYAQGGGNRQQGNNPPSNQQYNNQGNKPGNNHYPPNTSGNQNKIGNYKNNNQGNNQRPSYENYPSGNQGGNGNNGFIDDIPF